MRLVFTLTIVMVSDVITDPSVGAAADAAAREHAAKGLQTRGLFRDGQNTVWLLPIEKQFRSICSRVDAMKRQVRDAEADVNNAIRVNTIRWREIEPVVQRLRGKLKQLSKSDPQRRSLEQELQRLATIAAPPKEIGAKPQVRALVIRWSSVSNDIVLSVSRAERLAAEIQPSYDRLQADQRVTAALSQLGGSHRLGPLADDQDQRVKALRQLRRNVLTDRLPVYQLGGYYRVSLIVNRGPAGDLQLA